MKTNVRLTLQILLAIANVFITSVSLANTPRSRVVENYKSVVADALPAKHPVHLQWKGESYELPGTLEDEISATRFRESVRLPDAPYSDAWILQDGVAVEFDSNQQVQTQTGNGLAKFQSLHAVMSGTWLNDNGKIEDLAQDGAGHARIRWTPKQGALIEITFGDDHLISEIQIDQGGGQMARYEYSGWIKKSGVYVPQKQTQHEPNVEQAATWTLQNVDLFNNKPFDQPTSKIDAHLPENQKVVTLPLSLYQGRYIQVPVRFGDVHSIFILDTGASVTCISQSLAKKLNLPFKGKMTQKEGVFKDAYFVKSPSMDVSGAMIDPQTIIALDMDSGEFGAMMPGIGGIIGYDFLSRFVAIIDYQGGRLEFSPIDGFSPKSDDVAIPVENDQSSLLIPVSANGKSAKFILDTGNGGGIAIQHMDGQESWVNALEKKSAYDESGLRFGSGISGVWKSYVDFSVGPFHWPHVRVSIANQKAAKGGSLTMAGNVGSSFLKQFRVSIDMKTPRIWFAQMVPFRDRMAYTTFGLTISGGAHGAKVRSIDKGGAAANAGLKVGDEITKINGMDSARVVPHIASLLVDAIPGEKLHLRVLRDSKVTEKIVTASVIP